MNAVRLDRRYAGYERFTHRVEFWGRDAMRKQKQWVKARNWLWQQYGPSGELFVAHAWAFDGNQPKWAWDADKSSIYMTEEVYTMFILKKECWEHEQNL